MLLSRQIEKIRTLLLDLGALCEESVEKAARSAVGRDCDLARSVLAGDDRIDDAEIELEEECLHALALYQPVAFDLRYIVAVLKMTNDLERIGDLAGNIATTTLILSERPPVDAPPFDLVEMSRLVREMLHQALNALVNLDAALAEKVRAEDDQVDAIHRGVYDAVQKMIRQNPENTAAAIDYLALSRHLERIADHAAYIARDVICLNEGDFSSYHPRQAK